MRVSNCYWHFSTLLTRTMSIVSIKHNSKSQLDIYSSKVKVDCFDMLAWASIAVAALARICCFARREVSIVYSTSKTLERANFMLATIDDVFSAECFKRLIKAPNFESSAEV